MHTYLLHILLPVIASALLAGLIRWVGGAERGARLAGIAVVGGFLVAWGVVLRPGWVPHDDLSRVGHVAFGAAVVGLALDFFALRRLWAAFAAATVVLVSAWASVNGGLAPMANLSWLGGLAIVGLAVAAFFVVSRLDGLAAGGHSALVILVMLAFGLAALAAVVGDDAVAAGAAMLALAVAGYALTAAFLGLPTGDAVVLGAGSAVLAVAWALVQRNTGTTIGVLLLLLMLFAEGTARRVPLPKARVSAILYPLILAGISALPLLLAVLAVYATGRS